MVRAHDFSLSFIKKKKNNGQSQHKLGCYQPEI